MMSPTPRHGALLAALGMLLIFAGPSEVAAQQLDTAERVTFEAEQTVRTPVTDLQPLHITDRLVYSERGRAALEEYHRKKKAGLLPATKSGGGASLMTTREFRVLNVRDDVEENIEFTLMVEEDRFNLWVETTQLATEGGVITDQDLEQMRVTLAESTSADSFRPDSGIVALDELVFGPPPNVDGDSKTDILIHDIIDFYDPANGQLSAVLGFFDPTDLNAPNSADIIHIDIMPGMYTIDGQQKPFEGVQQTLAHEYQHLIFATANSGQGPAFVDEGLAEWAEVITGFTARSITYLASESERGRPFTDFRGDVNGSVETFGGPNGEDYQRAGLFTNYISERIGVLETGAMSRTSSPASPGYYTTVLQPDLALENVLVNFHVANLLNDASVGAEFGYAEDQYSSVFVTNIETIDGVTQSGLSSKNGELQSGSVDYIRFNNVAEFNIDVDALSGTATDRSRLRFVLVANPVGAQTTMMEAMPGDEPLTLNGDYQDVTLVAVHDDLSTTASVSYVFSADWNASQTAQQFQEVAVEDGAVVVTDGFLEGFPLWNPPGNSLAVNDRAANRFDIPGGSVLTRVEVALLYRSLFEQTSSPARDFKLRVWTVAQNGEPDGEIISLDVTDNSAPFNSDQSEYVFLPVDLSAFSSQLSALSGSLAVSVENTGTDDNHILVPHSNLTASTNPSYLYTEFGTGQEWASYRTLSTSSGATFENFANTIRATFLLAGATDVEDEDTLPRTAALDQNYPNPFNPSTTIRFSLPQSSAVTLQVFDMLGRRVATLEDGVLPAGRHEVRFDADELSSGLYLYRLATADRQITRTMMLVK